MGWRFTFLMMLPGVMSQMSLVNRIPDTMVSLNAGGRYFSNSTRKSTCYQPIENLGMANLECNLCLKLIPELCANCVYQAFNDAPDTGWLPKTSTPANMGIFFACPVELHYLHLKALFRSYTLFKIFITDEKGARHELKLSQGGSRESRDFKMDPISRITQFEIVAQTNKIDDIKVTLFGTAADLNRLPKVHCTDNVEYQCKSSTTTSSKTTATTSFSTISTSQSSTTLTTTTRLSTSQTSRSTETAPSFIFDTSSSTEGIQISVHSPTVQDSVGVPILDSTSTIVSQNESERGSKKNESIIVVAVLVPIVIIIIIAFVVFVLQKKKRGQANMMNDRAPARINPEFQRPRRVGLQAIHDIGKPALQKSKQENIYDLQAVDDETTTQISNGIYDLEAPPEYPPSLPHKAGTVIYDHGAEEVHYAELTLVSTRRDTLYSAPNKKGRKPAEEHNTRRNTLYSAPNEKTRVTHRQDHGSQYAVLNRVSSTDVNV
eukprot:m.67488 g.67488  ORF g.67488 m.67488 type:complete len:490 (-) comp11893_c0_seq1:89-1558(-)